MKMTWVRLFILILLAGIYSCKSSPDLEKEKKALLVIHNEQRKAHMEKNVPLLVGDGWPDYVEVNRGLIKRPSKEESMKRFQAYFDAVDFVKWDDVSEPVFSFSDDATMATTVVDKLVITKQRAQGNRLDTAHYAWLAVYRKVDGKWRMERMASTNK
jgi:hypothetical protein